MTGRDPQAEVRAFLRRHGLLRETEQLALTPLTGGVSSDLWKAEMPDRTVCVKGALAKLKVGVDWRAPVSRNRVEYDWLRFAAQVCPGQVPRVLAFDGDAGLLAMEFLPPENHPVWKTRLLSGSVDVTAAREVGDLVGRLHSASSADPASASRFATDENFDALRIEPFLRVTAAAHPDLQEQFSMIADATADIHLAVVHGDVTPKNILLGLDGPVLLDAECAWFGDPAFDIALCLTHLLIKAVKMPGLASELGRAAHALVDGHVGHLDWERPEDFGVRVATLVPALALARVDGQSRVEYLDTGQAGQVRTIARALMRRPGLTAAAVIDDWVAARATTIG